MAETTLLKAEEREETGKSQARLIRKNGQIPCIIYGDKKEPMAASLSACLLYTSPSPRDS